MATILFLIFYFTNIISIICINARNNFFANSIIKKLLPSYQYEKYFNDYNINILLNKDKKNEKEFLINSDYITKNFLFDFSYSGKLFSLNDANINLLSTKDYNNRILLIRNNSTFNNFIIQNKKLVRFITKVIIVPDNTIPNIHLLAKYFFYDLSVLILELNRTIFEHLNNYNEGDTINIISKKVDLFSFIFLNYLLTIIIFLLYILTYLYRFLLNLFKPGYNMNQINFFKSIHFILYFKIFILLLLYVDLRLFYNVDGIVFEYTSFLKSLLIFFMIINESNFISLIQRIYYGIGINMKGDKIKGILMGYLTGFYIVFYILFNVFINPLRIPYAFYILNIFVSFPIFSEMIYFSIKNIFFLCKVYFKVRSIQSQNIKYGEGIRLKIYFIITQFIFLLFFAFFYLVLQEYLLFKKGLCFSIEKDILFQCFECCFIILLTLIYLPRDFPRGYELYILLIHNSKKTSKINILPGDNYTSSLPQNDLSNEEDIKKYVRSNINNYYVILSPKVFFDKNQKDNNNNNNRDNIEEKGKYILAKNVKLGKLIRT